MRHGTFPVSVNLRLNHRLSSSKSLQARLGLHSVMNAPRYVPVSINSSWFVTVRLSQCQTVPDRLAFSIRLSPSQFVSVSGCPSQTAWTSRPVPVYSNSSKSVPGRSRQVSVIGPSWSISVRLSQRQSFPDCLEFSTRLSLFQFV